MHRLARVSLGVFLISSVTLMVEVLLLRVFDVILQAHLGYFVVTCAMFAVGLSGVFSVIFPLGEGEDPGPRAAVLALALAVVLLLRPVLNVAPEIYRAIDFRPLRYAVGVGIIYSALLAPFFFSGLTLAYIFSAGASRIGRLYFFDLAGAALGCVVWVPFIRGVGPGGLLVWAAGILCLAAALFSGRRLWWAAGVVGALVLLLIPLLHDEGYLDFWEHRDKRGVLRARRAGRVEFSEWDPVSKIYVVNRDSKDPETGERIPRPRHVAYDGGSQSSHFFPFDGDFDALRKIVLEGLEPVEKHFWRRDLLVSHYLKRDTGATVLICGSAAGQETKAALLFNASRVDGIELVQTVVRLGKERYSDFIGGIFNDPRVRNRHGEARSFLRSTEFRYDIIQIFSNHTSSYIASGSSASVPVYLQTVEAYEEYFTHLTDDGILHVNHHFYPRMVSTASLAWKRLGRTDFQRHVLVYQMESWDTLPAMLIKMSPWTPAEIDEVESFLEAGALDRKTASRVVDPVDPESSFLSAAFFAGGLPEDLARSLDYRAQPSTDDWPFFSNIQTHLRPVKADPERFLDSSMEQTLNGRSRSIAGEYSHFLGSGLVALLFALLLVVLPLLLSEAGRTPWTAKYFSLGYFACLGLAFIIIELVLVHLFMKLIGFPIYSYAVVILSMLLAAGCGSLSVEPLGVNGRRWPLPFLGIVGVGALFLTFSGAVFDPLLGKSLLVRIMVAATLIFPLGFFMGMPFPLGVLTIRDQPRGAVAWAWGVNGVFTVIGGILSGLLALLIGFHSTILLAIGVYVLAMGAFAILRLRIQRPASADTPI